MPGLGNTPEEMNHDGLLEELDRDDAFLDTDEGVLQRLPQHLMLGGDDGPSRNPR